MLDIGRSHFDIGSPSAEHNENFIERCKGPVHLEFGEFFNDLHDLNRLWTIWDFCGQTAPMPSARKIFSLYPILRQTCADLRRRRRISAPMLLDFARIRLSMCR